MKKSFRSISFYIILPIVIILLLMFSQQRPDSGVTSFSDLVKAVKEEKVTSMQIGDTTTIATIDGKEYKVEVNQIVLLTILGDEIEQQIKGNTGKIDAHVQRSAGQHIRRRAHPG